ncbi:hypothetical protein, partial [Salmonella enterica]|uniref:hypothetical protein n=1 Tax=Salmonella enterica TaxID=28901 RepID=UPI00193C8D64
PCSFTSIGTACAGTVILLKNVGDNYPDIGGYWVISVHENTQKRPWKIIFSKALKKIIEGGVRQFQMVTDSQTS